MTCIDLDRRFKSNQQWAMMCMRFRSAMIMWIGMQNACDQQARAITAAQHKRDMKNARRALRLAR